MRRFVLALPFLLASSAAALVLEWTPSSYAPLVASDGTDFLAVWARDSSQPVRALRFDREGHPLAEMIQIAPRGFPLAVGFGGGNYFVVWWESGGKLLAARLGEEPVVVASANAGSAAAVAFDGQRFLVVWFESGGLQAAFVGLDGSVSQPANLAPWPYYGYLASPSVAWNGSEFLVVWSEYRHTKCIEIPCPSVPDPIYALRLGADGTPLAPAMKYGGSYGHVSSGGDRFLLALDGYHDPRCITCILRIATAGDEARDVLHVFPFRSGIVSTGTDYQLAVIYALPPLTQYRLAVFRLSRSGEVMDSRFMEFGTSKLNYEPTLSVAANDTGDLVIGVRQDGIARVLLGSEITTPLPPRPQPPAVWADDATPVIGWSVTDDADGFLIERLFEGYWPLVMGSAPADARSAIITNGDVKRVQVRVFNAGGLSEPSAPVTLKRSRQRTVRH